MSEVSARRANLADLRFIHSSWHSTAWHVYQKDMDWERYSPHMDEYIDRVMARATTRVVFTPETPDEILGYSVSDVAILHFVYVKGIYRGMGIGTGLVRGKFTEYTQRVTGRAKAFMSKQQIKFNPFWEMR